MMRSPVRKNHNGLAYERDQPDQKELDAGAAQSSMRAGGQYRQALRSAARRAAHPARADEKLQRDGLRGHARSVQAVWIVQTDLAPYAQSGGLRDKMTSSLSSAVPTCVMRERHVQCGARGVRTRWVANL